MRVYGAGGRRLAEVGLDARQVLVSGLTNSVATVLSVRTAARASGGWDVESPGTVATVTPLDRIPPVPPSALAAFTEEGGVRLHWLPSRGEAYAKVVVLRAPEGGAFEELAAVPGNISSYLDTTVKKETTYLYSAAAADAAGNRSLPAREVRVRVPK